MSNPTHETTIIVNAWNLEDLHTNMASLNDRLAHLIAVASLASDTDDVKQLKGAIHVIKESLYNISAVSKNDHESMQHLINDAKTAQSIA